MLQYESNVTKEQVLLPSGFMVIKPVDDVGIMIIRTKCVHYVIEGANPDIIISPDGVSQPTFYTMIGGVMGGKKFSFKVENTPSDLFGQMLATGDGEEPETLILDPTVKPGEAVH